MGIFHIIFFILYDLFIMIICLLYYVFIRTRLAFMRYEMYICLFVCLFIYLS